MIDTDTIKSKMQPLKMERDNLDAEVSKLQRQASIGSKSPEALSVIQKMIAGELGIPGVSDTLTVDETQDKAIELIESQLSKEEIRKQLANVMPNIVKEVRINGNTNIEVHYVAGGIGKDMLV